MLFESRIMNQESLLRPDEHRDFGWASKNQKSRMKNLINTFLHNRWKEIFLLFFLTTFFIFSLNGIDLTTSDLGRHIKSGEYVFKDSSVLYKNFYSFTEGEFPFINHHWGTGVVFFLVYKLFSFAGLSVLFALISCLTFGFFFLVSWKRSNIAVSVLSSICAFPLILWRSEVRPEMFSYFFCGIYYLLVWGYFSNKFSRKILFFIPVLQIIWVNLHSYFFLGYFIIGVYFFYSLINLYLKKQGKEKAISLGIILFLSIIVSLLNPSGISGLLYPVHIFDNFGYRLLENQNLFFLEKILGSYPPGVYFRLLFLLIIFSWIWKTVREKKIDVADLIFTGFFLFIAVKAVRNFSLFAFFAIPVLSVNLNNFTFSKKNNINNFFYLLIITVIFPLIIVINPNFWTMRYKFLTGILKNNSGSADFFLQNNIKGPVFNNYDIGGYLIFYLFPKEKVFVDNRPEAYPSSFFTDVYIPMQENQDKWNHQIDKEYKFNVIFFQRNDLTPWAQQFLVSRIKDVNWAPVFVDNWTIIFLRRNKINNDLITKYELPNEMFSGNSNK